MSAHWSDEEHKTRVELSFNALPATTSTIHGHGIPLPHSTHHMSFTCTRLIINTQSVGVILSSNSRVQWRGLAPKQQAPDLMGTPHIQYHDIYIYIYHCYSLTHIRSGYSLVELLCIPLCLPFALKQGLNQAVEPSWAQETANRRHTLTGDTSISVSVRFISDSVKVPLGYSSMVMGTER